MGRQRGCLPSAGIKWIQKDEAIEKLKEAASSMKREREEVSSVILFGSMARGDHSGASDADLMVILKETALPFVERILEYRRYFLKLPFPVDVLVYTKDELDRMKAQGNPLALHAKAGKVLLMKSRPSIISVIR